MKIFGRKYVSGDLGERERERVVFVCVSNLEVSLLIAWTYINVVYVHADGVHIFTSPIKKMGNLS